MTYPSDREEVLIDNEEARKAYLMVQRIGYFEGYSRAVLADSSPENKEILMILHNLGKNCLEDIENYKQLPDDLRLINDRQISKLEQLAQIFVSNKEENSERFEKALAIINS